MRASLLAVAILLAQAVAAEPNVVTIPGQGWHLMVDVPPLTSSEGKSNGQQFSYTGADVNSGITFSIHTEDMKNGTNETCRKVYWTKARKNPYIVKGSPVLFESTNLVGVTYRAAGEFRGRSFTTVNAHGYFVKKNKCVDLHVSQIPYTEAGKAEVERIVRSAKVIE